MSEWWNSLFDKGVWNFLVITPLISYRLSGNSQSYRTGSEVRSIEYPADRRSAKLTSRLLLMLMQEALASCPTLPPPPHTHTFRARYQDCEDILIFAEPSIGTDGGGGMVAKFQIYVRNFYGRHPIVFISKTYHTHSV